MTKRLRLFSEQDIVDAYDRTGIRPVRRTWSHVWYDGDYRSPCGCALVCLAVDAGIDLENALLPLDERSYAKVLGTTEYHALGIVNGWDVLGSFDNSFRYHPANADARGKAHYKAGWEAAHAAAKRIMEVQING